MLTWPLDWWDIDPLPLAPDVPVDSTAYWRWRSRVTLLARRVG